MGVTFKGGRSPKTSGIRTDSVNYHIGVLSLKKETNMYGDGRLEHIYSRKYIGTKLYHYNSPHLKEGMKLPSAFIYKFKCAST